MAKGGLWLGEGLEDLEDSDLSSEDEEEEKDKKEEEEKKETDGKKWAGSRFELSSSCNSVSWEGEPLMNLSSFKMFIFTSTQGGANLNRSWMKKFTISLKL